MPPFIALRAIASHFDEASSELEKQWTHPGDVFSVLLILGGDVVARALAQSTGGTIGSPLFSFGKIVVAVACAERPRIYLKNPRSRGSMKLKLSWVIGWVAYSVSALVAAVGENKLMPKPDYNCIVINGTTGYSRANTSWILGRLVRDYKFWRDISVDEKIQNILTLKWEELKADALKIQQPEPERPDQAGLCVSIYNGSSEKAGMLVWKKLYLYSILVAVVQLSIAAIPCVTFGDWAILIITSSGILLSSASASLPQWRREKWACRRLPQNGNKSVIFTKGNGSQHAIVVQGCEGFLDIEALATGQESLDVSTSKFTKAALWVFAFLWIILLITAAGLKQNTWFLLAVGGIGIVFNIWIAGSPKHPKLNGIPIEFKEVIGGTKVMKTLYAVEEKYPHLGKAMLGIFFPGKLRKNEEIVWNHLVEDGEATKRAATYRDQGRWDDAEELERRLMKAFNEELGANHHLTLTSIANLASIHTSKSRTKEWSGKTE